MHQQKVKMFAGYVQPVCQSASLPVCQSRNIQKKKEQHTPPIKTEESGTFCGVVHCARFSMVSLDFYPFSVTFEGVSCKEGLHIVLFHHQKPQS